LTEIRHPATLVSSTDDLENFQKLAHRAVDGVLCDRLVGIHLTSTVGLPLPMAEYPLGLGSVPIHVMFSRKTCIEADVAAFNRGLADFRSSGQYRDTLRSYMLPLLIAESTNQPWFLILDFIGTAAFAISGILLARKERYNIVGALLLAALPAVGGGVVRDLITGRHPVGILRSPVYLLIVLFVVLFGYISFFI
jgi:polar amino acid transport system substrate-binding protein